MHIKTRATDLFTFAHSGVTSLVQVIRGKHCEVIFMIPQQLAWPASMGSNPLSATGMLTNFGSCSLKSMSRGSA